GHDSQHGKSGFVAHGSVERYAMLLNRPKLGRGLCANDVASAEERVSNHLFGLLEARPARVLANFNDLARQIANLREQFKRRNAFEVVVPVFRQDFELRKILFLPVNDCAVVLGSNGGCRVGHLALQYRSAWFRASCILSNERSKFKSACESTGSTTQHDGAAEEARSSCRGPGLVLAWQSEKLIGVFDLTQKSDGSIVMEVNDELHVI